MVRKDLPANNLQEFIAYTKANQAKMQYGSGGTGTSSHIGCVLLNQTIGVDVTHVPYRGGGPALQDLIAGRIDYICNYVSTALPAVKHGQVKALAMLARERAPAFSRCADRRRAGAEGLRRLGLERDLPAQERDAGDGGQAQRGRRARRSTIRRCGSGSTTSA